MVANLPFTISFCYSPAGRYSYITSVTFGAAYGLASGYSINGASSINGSSAVVSAIIYENGALRTTLSRTIRVDYNGNVIG